MTTNAGTFALVDGYLRYQRLLSDGTVWQDIAIDYDVESPREYVCEVLGQDERQYLPENAEEHFSFLCGLIAAARMERDERDRATSKGPALTCWGATGHNAHGYRP